MARKRHGHRRLTTSELMAIASAKTAEHQKCKGCGRCEDCHASAIVETHVGCAALWSEWRIGSDRPKPGGIVDCLIEAGRILSTGLWLRDHRMAY